MTPIQIQEKLKSCHETENKYNKEISRLDKVIKDAIKKKESLAKRVSKNMRYRNQLISKL